jgi:hypothetical protein
LRPHPFEWGSLFQYSMWLTGIINTISGPILKIKEK